MRLSKVQGSPTNVSFLLLLLVGPPHKALRHTNKGVKNYFITINILTPAIQMIFTRFIKIKTVQINKNSTYAKFSN